MGHAEYKMDDTKFVEWIHGFFRWCGRIICTAPWTCIVICTVATAIFSLKIPFTEMENNISDFTPYEARARAELKNYQEFFSNRGEPKAIYAFCSAKAASGNLLSVAHFNETVQVLDKISRDFYLKTKNGSKNFEQFCSGFCTLNEPVRHFYSGMQISDQYANESRHLDLGYPVTTVLGTKLYMDPNFFGVKIATNGPTSRIVSVADSSTKIDGLEQVPNNIRELSLIVLQFRAEIGHDVDPEDLKSYEREIVSYFHETFHTDHIQVHILTDSFITAEIVRAGLSLLPFLVIGFVIMSTFSGITFAAGAVALGQWNVYRLVLALMACVTPFMACGLTMGVMFHLGFRFGSILCVTPFLILAIGVDDAYLMSNAWNRITEQRRKSRFTDVDIELRHRVLEMLVETGPSVSITTITNFLAFGIGALTPTPEIQLFSIGNALAVAFDFVFQVPPRSHHTLSQIFIYAAFMVIIGRGEICEEAKRWEETAEDVADEKKSEKVAIETEMGGSGAEKRGLAGRVLSGYCNLISNTYVSSAVLGFLAVYWYISIIGTLNIKSELSPNKLFLQTSPINKIFEQRSKYIIPYYELCWVLINEPGDIGNSSRKRKIFDLVEELEGLDGSVGRYSSKFWMRDYEDFLRQAEELDELEEFNEPGNAIEFTVNGSLTLPSVTKPKGNELRQFLEWPEFSFWKGFIQYNSTDGINYDVNRFFLTTAYHGQELTDWSNRALLLEKLRVIADKYPDLGVWVYMEDGKFLDLIATMAPIASQSALFTFISMFIVAMLFISHPSTLAVATLSILSTSLGVFGIMSWWGADLDPILMSATVMSIGFSVDIPSHISYHYYQTGKEKLSVSARLELTIAAVGFPILQASLSTILCVSSLFFVDLHMSQLFAKCMLLVVVIGMIHGLVVIPVIFNLLEAIPLTFKRKKTNA